MQIYGLVMLEVYTGQLSPWAAAAQCTWLTGRAGWKKYLKAGYGYGHGY